MKKLSVLLCITMLIASISFSETIFADAPQPIAIMIESGGFDATNVSGDNGTTLFWKKGDADTVDGYMRVAPSGNGRAGTIVRRNQIQITDGFSTYFKMKMHNSAGMGYGDGLAFVIYESNTPLVGGYGGGLGYEGIDKSIAIEFDTWVNAGAGYNDPNPDGGHVAIMKNGVADHGVNQATQPTNSDTTLENVELNVWIDYDDGIISVTYGPNDMRGNAENKGITRNVGTFLENKNVFVGFSAATGGAMSDHDVMKWYFQGSAVVGGLSPTAGTYSQGASTLDVTVASENPVSSTIVVKDALGTSINNATGTLYLDDVSVGAFDTGAGGGYAYTIPTNLANGVHTLRAVASGGASNFKNFTVAKYTVTYNGNGHTGGDVPAAVVTYDNGASVTVLGNTGNFVKTNYTFAGWNTADDGTGTSYVAGNTFAIAANKTLYAIWTGVDATINNSAETATYELGNQSGAVIDSQVTVSAGLDITGAKVYITTGYETTKDELLYTNAGGITGTYDADKGVLTLTGTKTPAEYQAALRTIRFKTSGSTGNRTIVYTLGTKLSYAGHFYEYVAHGGNITWTDAKVAAEGRYFYGSKGYLATITTQAENDFLRDKLGADAWIGASDSGVENTWKWAVDAPAAEADVAFFNDANGTTADGYFSNWNTNEPNDADGIEDYAIMYCTGGTPGRWNDLPNNGSITGYLVEYNDAVGASSTKTLGVSNAPASTPSTLTPVTSTVIVIVNGVEQNAGTETKSTEEGKTVVTVEVNNEVIDAKIDEAIVKNPEGTGNVLQVPVADTTSDVVKVELTGDIIKKLEENTFEVSIKRDDVEYLIPAEEFTISDIAKDLGVTEASLKDIKIEVQITKLEPAVVAEYTKVAKANGAEIVFPPVAFEIIAKTTQTDGKTSDINISKFSNYVERIMEIPAGVDPSKITTGIVFNSDGTYSHVPTEVFQKDGKWYARLNSLTNSNYSVVWNPVTVASVENQWSEDAVNDMASRLVIFDPEKFSPNKAITRGDFAEYIVRALGLYREGALGLSDFKDVNKENQRALAIKIAKDYGIITGYGDGLFKPNQPITREESMAMYARAMKITNLVGKNTTRINTYVDNSLISTWARSYAIDVLSAHVFNGRTSSKLSPKAYLTYAEAAQAIKNLLIESKLINK